MADGGLAVKKEEVRQVEHYEYPGMEVILFENEDVMTGSGDIVLPEVP